jgi:hypothetical protein
MSRIGNTIALTSEAPIDFLLITKMVNLADEGTQGNQSRSWCGWVE